MPKNLVERVGKGYLYRNLGRTNKDVVGNWPEAHAEVEAILDGAQASAEFLFCMNNGVTLMLLRQTFGFKNPSFL